MHEETVLDAYGKKVQNMIVSKGAPDNDSLKLNVLIEEADKPDPY